LDKSGLIWSYQLKDNNIGEHNIRLSLYNV
jgi:hypothetical protein